MIRRLVSAFSEITRRPHIPRCPQLRRLFKSVGIDCEKKSPAEGRLKLAQSVAFSLPGEAEEEDDGEPLDEEDMESEQGTDDDMVEEEAMRVISLFFN